MKAAELATKLVAVLLTSKAIDVSFVFKGRTKELNAHEFGRGLLAFVGGHVEGQVKERGYHGLLDRIASDATTSRTNKSGKMPTVSKPKANHKAHGGNAFREGWTISEPTIEADKEHALKLSFTITAPSAKASKLATKLFAKLRSEKSGEMVVAGSVAEKDEKRKRLDDMDLRWVNHLQLDKTSTPRARPGTDTKDNISMYA